MRARPPDSTRPLDKSIASRDPPPPSSRLTRCSTVGALGFGLGSPRDGSTVASLDIQQPDRHFRLAIVDAAPYVPKNRAATELAMQDCDTAMTDSGTTQFLELSGRRLAYRTRAATDRTRDCAGIVFLPGFRS